jgi:peptidyl-tRNA hydrolase, PTH1 family
VHLLCGLGNKGSEYSSTRHNVGYLVVERYASKFGIALNKRAGGCKFGVGADLVVVKPNTFMNLSGGPVVRLMRLQGLNPEALLLVHDDLDMDFGKIRIRFNGRDGGHKGVRSVMTTVGSSQFFRLKVGIGRSPHIPPEEYVLSPFSTAEAKELPEVLDRAVDALHMFMFDSEARAMSIFNRG